MTTYAYDVTEIAATCCCCGAEDSTLVGAAALARYLGGNVLVQAAFPETTPEVREIAIALRSGYYTCSACWEIMADNED